MKQKQGEVNFQLFQMLMLKNPCFFNVVWKIAQQFDDHSFYIHKTKQFLRTRLQRCEPYPIYKEISLL